MTSATLSTRARRLGGALEPVIGQVYFAPECHAHYVALGFDPSPGEFNGVAGPDGPAYFTSRGSLLGQVPGQVVAAAFGVFDPNVVVPAVAHGWSLTDASTIRAARDAGALAHLERHIGPDPDGLDLVGGALERAATEVHYEGRALTAGIMALDVPDHPLGRVFRFGDLLREFRGDSHIASWVSLDLDAVEIGLLTELYWGLPLRSYARTRGWSNDRFDAGEESLRSKGFIDESGFTESGRMLREQVETDTDRQMAGVVASFGDDLDDVIGVLETWGSAVRAGRGYPASGPHDLARTD